MLIRIVAVAIGLIASLSTHGLAATRTVYSLDEGWLIYPMPDFKLWPAQAQLSAEQIKQLQCPAPGNRWQPVRLPDDYVVRGEIAREPNAALLVGGAVCPLGARECNLPGSEPNSGKPGFAPVALFS